MKPILMISLLLTVMVMPGIGQALTEKDFMVETAEDLVNLCAASPGDPMAREAVHFCQGYFLGAYHYYVAENSGPEGARLVCFGDPPPSRNTIIKMFVEWAKEHPEHMKEPPVETEFRFLTEKWPCKR